MGKVFAAESIKQEAVPRQGDQECVAREFMAAAEEIPHLNAAIVFGSTALGTTKRRSDTDIAIAYDEKGDAAKFFLELRDTIQTLPQGELVEPFIVSRHSLKDSTAAAQGDIFMAEHLQLAAHDSVIPGINADLFAAMPDLLAVLPLDQAIPLAEQVTIRYITNKVRKFFNASRQNDISNYHRLQRAFELPTAITRKLVRLQSVRAHYGTQAFQAQFYNRDNLAQTSQQLSELLGDEWRQCSTWLIQRDQEYSHLLEETIDGDTSIATYQRWLDDIAQPSFDHALRLSVAALAIRESNSTCE